MRQIIEEIPKGHFPSILESLRDVMPPGEFPAGCADYLLNQSSTEKDYFTQAKDALKQVSETYLLVGLSRKYSLLVFPIMPVIDEIKTLPVKKFIDEGYVLVGKKGTQCVAITPFPWRTQLIKSSINKLCGIQVPEITLGFCRYSQWLEIKSRVERSQTIMDSKSHEAVNKLVGDDDTRQKFILDFEGAVTEEMKPTNELLKPLIGYTVSRDGSDIHIESAYNNSLQRTELKLRVRIGEVRTYHQNDLRDGFKFTQLIHNRLVQLCKIQKQGAQVDGEFQVKVPKPGFPEPIVINVRFASMRYEHGYHITLRILDNTKKLPTLHELMRFAPHVEQWVRQQMVAPDGAVIICGPTGSGKTTTLYVIFEELDKDGNMIYSLEDPTEYNLSGVTQFDVRILAKGETGANFNPWQTGLKALLRKDPDILLVGEIRERDVAAISAEAVVTGHQLYSSLHCRSVTEFGTRLADLKIDPGAFVSSLRLVLSQRIMRRVCPKCSTPVEKETNEAATEWLKEKGLPEEWASDMVAHKCNPRVASQGANCPVCGGDGYKGVLIVLEAMDYTDDGLRELYDLALVRGRAVTPLELERFARQKNWPLMPVSALRAIYAGATDLREASLGVVLSKEVAYCDSKYAQSGRSQPTWEWEVNSK